MIHTLTIIRFLFPFLLLLAFFCLYKKPYRCMYGAQNEMYHNGMKWNGCNSLIGKRLRQK